MTETVVLVWGDDPFLVREAALEVLGGIRPIEASATEWRPELLSDLATPSLFGDERALLVVDAQDLRDEALEAVARHAAEPPPGSRLVLAALTAPRASSPPRALARALGQAVETRRAVVERRELPGWVRSRARADGIPATSPGASALVETVGEDPAALDQAVRQIAVAHPRDGLTPETVAAQFRGLGDRRVWELSDAAFGGDLPRAVRILASLLAAGEEPLAMVGGIGSRLRDLLRVRDLPEGMPPAELAREAGLRFDWQARRYRDQARRFTVAELAGLHAEVVASDAALKQGAAPGAMLPLLVTRIAAEARAGDRARPAGLGAAGAGATMGRRHLARGRG